MESDPIRNDPIVEEMRRNFEAMAAQFDFDVHRIAEYLRQQEAKHPERIARRVPRKPYTAENELSPVPTINDLCMFFRFALRFGVLDLRSILAWADRQIEAQPHRPSWVIDLSLARSTEEAEATLCRAEVGDIRWALALLLAQLWREWTAQSISFEGASFILGDIAFRLQDVFPDAIIPEELRKSLLPVIEEREIVGNPDQRMRDFLEGFSFCARYLEQWGIPATLD